VARLLPIQRSPPPRDIGGLACDRTKPAPSSVWSCEGRKPCPRLGFNSRAPRVRRGYAGASSRAPEAQLDLVRAGSSRAGRRRSTIRCRCGMSRAGLMMSRGTSTSASPARQTSASDSRARAYSEAGATKTGDRGTSAAASRQPRRSSRRGCAGTTPARCPPPPCQRMVRSARSRYSPTTSGRAGVNRARRLDHRVHAGRRGHVQGSRDRFCVALSASTSTRGGDGAAAPSARRPEACSFVERSPSENPRAHVA